MNIAELLRKIDRYLGTIVVGAICCVNFLINGNNNHKNYKNVLVIRLWTLGESILTLPMIKKLKDEGYNVTILVTDRSKGVFENVDFVDEIIGLENFWKVLKKQKM